MAVRNEDTPILPSNLSRAFRRFESAGIAMPVRATAAGGAAGAPSRLALAWLEVAVGEIGLTAVGMAKPTAVQLLSTDMSEPDGFPRQYFGPRGGPALVRVKRMGGTSDDIPVNLPTVLGLLGAGARGAGEDVPQVTAHHCNEGVYWFVPSGPDGEKFFQPRHDDAIDDESIERARAILARRHDGARSDSRAVSVVRPVSRREWSDLDDTAVYVLEVVDVHAPEVRRRLRCSMAGDVWASSEGEDLQPTEADALAFYVDLAMEADLPDASDEGRLHVVEFAAWREHLLGRRERSQRPHAATC